jgi:hypothetical protein
MVRADTEAQEHGERLLRLYPKEASQYPQAKAILEDLQRRRKKGTFGRQPRAKWPDGFAAWKVDKKIAYLIDPLEEVDARQWGQPGGVDLASDPRVGALIALGDAAVPRLIDVVERDRRLTRSVHFWRDFDRGRTVLGVREAALTAVMSILRVQVFKPTVTGDNLTSHGKGLAESVAARLRAYWAEYGHLPLDERMMKVLTDPKAKPEALREAAYNLGHLGDKRTLGTMVSIVRQPGRSRKPNPAVAKFHNPTAAEAILAAMDRDLAAYDAGKRDSLYDYRRRQIEDDYLDPLVELGDRRIAPELAKRCQAAPTVRMRRKWAFACHWLGDPEPLWAFVRDFRAGKIKLPANDEPDTNPQD